MAAKKKYKHPLVEVLWVDAETTQGWETAEEVSAVLPEATTVGFLIRETEDALLIASTYSEDHSNGRIKIPKGMIKNMRTL